MEGFKSRPFYYRLKGDYALFTDPVSKGGGEKFTYQIPTYQALKGITEQVYWKPTIYWVVDALKVINPIQTETKGVRSPLNNGGNDLNYYTYLRKVEYLVKVHFEWNMNRDSLLADRNEKKHEQMALRSLKRGGRRDIFIGTRECIGNVEYIKQEEFDGVQTAFNGTQLSYGMMFHSFIYPDEGENDGDYGILVSSFAPVIMSSGRVDFIRPEECEIQHKLSTANIKCFNTGNTINVDQELREYEEMGCLKNERFDCSL